MTTFLRKTAELLWTESAGQTAEQTVILPGRRAGLYLKRELAALVGKPIWAPRMLTLGEFLQEITGIRQADNSEMIFVAYQAYKECRGQESFDDFLQWAHSALADFATVDHYLADARKFFSNLRDIREIEQWSLRDEPLSADQLRLVEFWNQLGQLYFSLRDKLSAQGVGYPAMITRLAAENPDDLDLSSFGGNLWMVGFNAMSPAEQKVAEHLVKTRNMRVLWDADKYYLDDEMNEAGLHLRGQMQRLPNLLPTSDDLGSTAKEICLHSLSGEASQAKAVARILAAKPDASDTAVVLCNNHFLAPVLESIPPHITEFNVSAGISLASTPLLELVKAVFSLFSKEPKADEQAEIYHRHLLRFLQLPLVARPAESISPGVIGQFKSHLIKYHRITVNWAEDSQGEGLEALRTLDPVMACVNVPGAKGVLLLLERLTDLLTQNAGLSDIETEYVFQLARLTRQVKGLTEKYPFADSMVALRSLFLALLRAEQITFYGEPLTGLQIIGLLETRNLDFKHVILLGANEDVLPASRSDHSLIPHDLKAAFNMPGYKHRDALFAYYFYRLIQRAERVDILYSTGAEGTRTSEVSRFVRQLMHEAPGRNPNIRFTEGKMHTQVGPREHPMHIASTPEIREEIKKQLSAGLSPSALNKFFTCPLDYYYRYVLGLGEPDEMEETPEASTFGSIVHDSLEEIYTPFTANGPLTSDALKSARMQVPEIVKRHFTDYYPEKHMYQGQNLLIYRACEHYVRNLLDCDIERINEGERVEILALEETISHSLTLEDGTVVRFSGKADRIEKTENAPMIVDYKTGSGTAIDLRLSHSDQFKTKGKALQLMLYAWIWQRTNPGKEVRAGIVFLRNHRSGVLPLVVGKEDLLHDKIFDAFENWLRKEIALLLSPDFHFEHLPKSKYCIYCN